ncbi:4-oxalmesaconate hydratase [Alteribacillus persepolensis]|uniref:4-oxalmesaconate hydratase n=1 Tax=Alteribacillus persepolensis TaxID=568899 RepID=A0A1G8AWT9_9BACI|nr:amidohydrolase family protein [Alteribacillus persepolensis]SDH25246.1 4-oxalmesaconate hydratase [Alteribacillus persepolensis]
MIIDIHGHTVAPPEVYQFQGRLLGSRGNPFDKFPELNDEAINNQLLKHIELLNKVGTDMQFISPRPYLAMHSIKPERVSHLWTEFVNNVIARQVELQPGYFRGVAGLPQHPGADIRDCIPELKRCVEELGFVGVQLNPDPMEGGAPDPPGLGDEYWYPLYEEIEKLDVPILIHSASCCSPRESYTLHFINEESIAIMSLLESDVFEHFPNLKFVVSHTGGAIPFHMGRFRAWRLRSNKPDFDESVKQLYFDTVNYSKEALELAFKVIGSDNLLFGTENPGTGSVMNPETGHTFDDLKPVIESIEFLTEEDKMKVFEGNAKKLYNLNI